mgnify:CR=1 FL=1
MPENQTLGYALMGNPRYEITDGHIFFNGKDITEESPAERARDGSSFFPEPIEVRQVLFQNSDEYVETPVYLRDKFVPGQSIPGPCICEQMDTTLVVPKGWVIHVDGYHNLKIHDEEAK